MNNKQIGRPYIKKPLLQCLDRAVLIVFKRGLIFKVLGNFHRKL